MDQVMEVANHILIITPANVAIKAPGSVYRVFVIFTDIKYTDMV